MYKEEDLLIRERLIKEQISVLESMKDELNFKIMRLKEEKQGIALILRSVNFENQEVHYNDKTQI